MKKNKTFSFKVVAAGLIIVFLLLYFITLRPDTDLEVTRVGVQPDRGTVQAFDLERYMGVWYELGRTPVRFEEGCACVMAEYTLQEDSVKVVNVCRRTGLQDERIQGVASTTETPGLFKLQFFPLSSSEYRVLWVNDDYTMAVVNGGETVWILGRSDISQEAIAAAVKIAEDRGFKLDNMIFSGEECYA